MFDRVTQAAEKLATNVSRRAFLGRLGQRALATAGVLGAMLVFGGKASAITYCGGRYCRLGEVCCAGKCIVKKPGTICE